MCLPHVIDEFVFGFKRALFSLTILPVTCVVLILLASDVFIIHVEDDLIHCAEFLQADLFGFLVDPFTYHGLLEWGAHEVYQGSWARWVWVSSRRWVLDTRWWGDPHRSMLSMGKSNGVSPARWP